MMIARQQRQSPFYPRHRSGGQLGTFGMLSKPGQFKTGRSYFVEPRTSPDWLSVNNPLQCALLVSWEKQHVLSLPIDTLLDQLVWWVKTSRSKTDPTFHALYQLMYETFHKESCFICMEKLGMLTSDPCPTCKVKYHNRCLTQWHKTNLTCPHCRHLYYTIDPRIRRNVNVLMIFRNGVYNSANGTFEPSRIEPVMSAPNQRVIVFDDIDHMATEPRDGAFQTTGRVGLAGSMGPNQRITVSPHSNVVTIEPFYALNIDSR